MNALSLLISLGTLVCFVLVLIKQFQQKGALHGILGIISCGIYTFIWGWMESTRLGIKNIMIAWSALIVLGLVIRFVFLSAPVVVQ